MTLTLSSSISPTDRVIAVTGTVPDDIERGFRFRIDDEALVFTAFEPRAVVGSRRPGPSTPRAGQNRARWKVQRGDLGTEPASHETGTEIVAVADAWGSGIGVVPPSPFDAPEGGAITPGPFLEPTSATPEGIVLWLLAHPAGLMEAEGS